MSNHVIWYDMVWCIGDRSMSPISSSEDLFSPTKKVTNKTGAHIEKNGHTKQVYLIYI